MKTMKPESDTSADLAEAIALALAEVRKAVLEVRAAGDAAYEVRGLAINRPLADDLDRDSDAIDDSRARVKALDAALERYRASSSALARAKANAKNSIN